MVSARANTVVVLGATYCGARAAQIIAAELPEGWRLVPVDRNSHLNHVYILPRLAVLPGHERKACSSSYPTATYLISGLDEPVTVYIHPSHHSRPRAQLDHRLARGVEKDGVLCFNYAVYALGSRLPAPLDLWDTPSSSFNRTFACTSSRVLQAPRLERVDLSSLSSPASSSSDSANDANDITTVRTTAGREIRADLVPRKLPVFLFLSLRLLEDSWASSFRPNAKRPTPPSCAHSPVPNAAHLAIAVLFHFAYVWSNTDEGQRTARKVLETETRFGVGCALEGMQVKFKPA
ncbi:hypothetical protein B0H13DRAFT_2492549 [Mycena leptocephala]|nr:hypothetical protein B0H13DRAFT_2492549 [Mycena leptocephala]